MMVAKNHAKLTWPNYCEKYRSGAYPLYISRYDFDQDSFGTFGMTVSYKEIGDAMLRSIGIDPQKMSYVLEWSSDHVRMICYDNEYHNVDVEGICETAYGLVAQQKRIGW